MTELVKYEAACRAIAEARAVDEVKDIRDKAEAMRVYARQAKNKQLEVDAAEIRFRAERRLGEGIREQREAGLLAQGKRTDLGCEKTQVQAPTLAEVGIDKSLADRARKLAAIPEAEFEQTVSEWRGRVSAENERVTVNLLRAGARAQAREERDAQHHDTATVDDLHKLVERGDKYGVIYADPPWLYGNQGTRAATGNHYGGMTVDELCELPVKALSADDAFLHLWTTNAFLFECERIMEAWGYEYRSVYVWAKPQMGIGNYWRVSHEFLLLGRRGSPEWRARDIKSWGQFDRGRHSAKPEQVRQHIERACAGPYLEMFARRPAPGWVCWGNEIERGLLYGDVEHVA